MEDKNSLKYIRIILVETSHPGNIGAAARAMLTMGLAELYLVNPKERPNEVSEAMASGANELLDQAIIVDTLDEALQGIEFVVGTSARTRKLDIPLESVRVSAEKIYQQANSDVHCAILFGRERTGLYNDELLKCHHHAYIPSNPEYCSLNLSQAVQVFCYELRCASICQDELKALPEVSKEKVLASSEQNEGFYQHLEEMLYEVGFLRKEQPGLVMSRMKRLFQRAQLEEVEVNILRGICKEAIKTSKK
ncbi:RNA methyltransferase [Francisellaceae bacterium]|nr:RNA methyltransferase [Francisellaceae bacterium]